MKIKRFSASYERWRKQLTALEEGKLQTVKRLAREARHELEMKMRVRQMNLSI